MFVPFIFAFYQVFGILSVWGLQHVLNLPSDISGSMYLVMMLVFVVPTGTNIVVLVELSSGYKAKQDMATIIAYQFAVAPILMSLSLAVLVQVASSASP